MIQTIKIYSQDTGMEFGMKKCWLVSQLVVEFYDISTVLGYVTPNPFLCKYLVLFQTIQFSMNTQFNCQKYFYFQLFSLIKQI